MRHAALTVVLIALSVSGVLACGRLEANDVPKTVLSSDGAVTPGTASALPTADPGADLSDLSFDFFDGGVGYISDYQGKPLVVNFFAKWCPPCVREMPEFEAVHQRLGDRVVFLGLSQDRSAEDADKLITSTGVTYDVGWDADLEVYEATGSMAMPTTAFVTADGRLADVFAGALDEGALIEQIEQSLGVRARNAI